MPNYGIILITAPVLALIVTLKALFIHRKLQDDDTPTTSAPTPTPAPVPFVELFCSDQFCCEETDDDCDFLGDTTPGSLEFVLSSSDSRIVMIETFVITGTFTYNFLIGLDELEADSLILSTLLNGAFDLPDVNILSDEIPAELLDGTIYNGQVVWTGSSVEFNINGVTLANEAVPAEFLPLIQSLDVSFGFDLPTGVTSENVFLGGGSYA